MKGTSMTVTLDSSRFGRVAIDPAAIVEFPDGLIGIGGSRYALLAREEDSPFVWLHSLDDPVLALPLTNPFRFFADYEVLLSDEEAERIGITDPAACDVWVTVRAAERPEDFRVNLRAPILVAAGHGHQVINQHGDAPVQMPLFGGVTAEAA
jgi:flagellar assembly factor FliW